MESASYIMNTEDDRRLLTAHLVDDLESKQRANTTRLLGTMFNAASLACSKQRDRDVVEWLRICVLAAVKVSTGGGGKASAKANAARMSSDAFVVDDDEEEEDDEYVPSDEEVVAPKKGGRSGMKAAGKTKAKARAKEEDKENVPLEVVKPIPQPTSTKGLYAKPYFFPGKDGFLALVEAIDSAQKTLDCCVFSLSDDSIADVLIRAKKRGVKVSWDVVCGLWFGLFTLNMKGSRLNSLFEQIRIITDNQQAKGKGSDVQRLQEEHKIPYKTDHSQAFMHHKFAVIDNKVLVNGSYNWSKNARTRNNENFIISNWPNCIEAFNIEFEKLWAKF
ncbi:hypothetical protein BC938DRAFT_481142 [Jimgerdemannia flammicorona]|uniref:Mitochondrial cardiolipin hydrolase n=1 Tax=Jimgerdemannia flammicorona TaxID=994334 RepID=A0A433QH12_9FUNG|nr:hypothetical protein BC938DRAFT_481142 [Jimgerdemannia flammicorona]